MTVTFSKTEDQSKLVAVALEQIELVNGKTLKVQFEPWGLNPSEGLNFTPQQWYD